MSLPLATVYGGHPPTRKCISGLTLIEVLITLLVLSIGLVGLSALQLSAVKNVHSSLQTSIAATAALDFEEKAWLRLAELDAGCVSFDTAFEEEFLKKWGPEQGPLGLPGLTVTVDVKPPDPLGEGETPVWRDFALMISWLEARFDDETQVEFDDETQVESREQFKFTVRVMCMEGAS